MSHAKDHWNEQRIVAERCLRHPFVQAIGDGTLDDARYRYFVGQDAFFLESFARGYAACLARSPDREGLYEFYDLLSGVFDELKLHRQAAEQLNIDLASVEPAQATLDYTNFLVGTGLSSKATLGETLAALTPCMRLYAFLGQSLAKEKARPSEPLYAEWVDTYASEDFEGLASTLEQLLDRYGAGTDRERENYHRAMELEHAFFDAAWNATS